MKNQRNHPTPKPKLIRRGADVEAIYGLTSRQQKRLCDEGRIPRVKLSGPTGPVWFLVKDLNRLVKRSTIPVGEKVKEA